MQDRELKKLLSETCQVRPGQESRAWESLRKELYGTKANASVWSWLFMPSWRGALVGVFALLGAILGGDAYLAHISPRSFATADSQSPGVYATAFYSRSAEAQVVWLNGMDAASDRPTYLDPTTDVSQPAPDSSGPNGDPNSL